MNGAPASSWRNPSPSATEYCASGATKKINRLLGRMGSGTSIRNVNIEALSAKASGLFALDANLMNLKAVIQKIVTWSASEAKAIEQDIAGISASAETVDAVVGAINPPVEVNMSTPAAEQAAAIVPASNVNNAIQIALALRAIDASLSTETIQAGTNAALAALYPAAAA